MSFSGLSLMGIGTSTADAPQETADDVVVPPPKAVAAPASRPLRAKAAAPVAEVAVEEPEAPVSTFRSSSPPLRGATAPAMSSMPSEFPGEEQGGEDAGAGGERP